MQQDCEKLSFALKSVGGGLKEERNPSARWVVSVQSVICEAAIRKVAHMSHSQSCLFYFPLHEFLSKKKMLAV